MQRTLRNCVRFSKILRNKYLKGKVKTLVNNSKIYLSKTKTPLSNWNYSKEDH